MTKVRSVVNEVFLFSDFFKFSLMKVNSRNSPVLFKGGTSAKTGFCVCLLEPVVSFSECLPTFLVSSSSSLLLELLALYSELLLFPDDDPTELRRLLLFLLPLLLPVACLLEGECSLIRVGFPAVMVMYVLALSSAADEPPVRGRSQLLEVLSKRLAKYSFSWSVLLDLTK